jgi:hypothetical protein
VKQRLVRVGSEPFAFKVLIAIATHFFGGISLFLRFGSRFYQSSSLLYL